MRFIAYNLKKRLCMIETFFFLVALNGFVVFWIKVVLLLVVLQLDLDFRSDKSLGNILKIEVLFYGRS